jgi:excisionase family DNA binding protein
MPKLLTIKDIAQIAQVAEPTVRGWISKRKFDAIKLPQGIRVKESVFEKYLEKRTIKAKS